MNHQIPSVEDGFKPIPLIRAFLPLLVISSIMAFLSLFTYFLIRTTEINDAIYIFFAVEGEYNFPTWFNASLWCSLAVLAFFISFFAKSDKIIRRGSRILGSIAIFASADEAIQIHEKLGSLSPLMAKYLPDSVASNLNFVLWIIPGLILALVVGFSMLKFIRKLPKLSRLAIFASAFLFLIGAIGFEVLSGLWLVRYGLDAYYTLITVAEEFLEMSSISLAIAALISLFQYSPEGPSLRLQIKH